MVTLMVLVGDVSTDLMVMIMMLKMTFMTTWIAWWGCDHCWRLPRSSPSFEESQGSVILFNNNNEITRTTATKC